MSFGLRGPCFLVLILVLGWWRIVGGRKALRLWWNWYSLILASFSPYGMFSVLLWFPKDSPFTTPLCTNIEIWFCYTCAGCNEQWSGSSVLYMEWNQASLIIISPINQWVSIPDIYISKRTVYHFAWRLRTIISYRYYIKQASWKPILLFYLWLSTVKLNIRSQCSDSKTCLAAR